MHAKIKDFNEIAFPPRRTSRWRVLPLLLALAASVLLADVAKGEEPDTVGAIHAAAQNNGVAVAPLLALSRCETGGTFDADAAGDYRWRDGRYVPTSRGAFQINDLDTGLYRHFRAQGYRDRTDPEQAADYVARVSRGDWAREGVTLSRWTCYRIARGGW